MLNVRLFTGLSLPPEIAANLEAMLSELQPLARIRWCLPENLHITLKFIGEWPLSRVPELSRLLFTVAAGEPVTAQLESLEFFPRALVARVASLPGLNALAYRTEEALAPLGIWREPREYRPHVTLARIPGNTPLEDLHKKVAAFEPASLGVFEAAEFHLYQSESGLYRKLASVPLK